MAAVRNVVSVDIAKTIGKGYNKYWHYKGRYVALKGGRGSKKSKTTAIRWIHLILEYPLGNLLVVRQVDRTNRDSTFADLKWAASQLKVSHLFKFTTSPLEATYLPTGQKILFRGLNDPMSLTSITVEKGYLCWFWIEEAYQVRSEDAFNKLDLSLRGKVDGVFKQMVLTFNPWNEKHWIKKRFFDTPNNENKLAFTTNYMCNEFLDDTDIQIFEEMKEKYPRRYKVEGLGDWGIAEGVIFDNWTVEEFDHKEIAKAQHYESFNGLDFGFTNDPTAFVNGLASLEDKKIYVYDEHYEKGMTNDEIAKMIKDKGYAKSKIVADSAEPKSIEEIKRAGISKISPAVKGADSVRSGIQTLKDFEIIVHPSCEHLEIELSNYVWDTGRDGTILNKPLDDFNHLIDALRYGIQIIKTKKKPSTFKAFM
jgi:phage terminase large subunit